MLNPDLIQLEEEARNNLSQLPSLWRLIAFKAASPCLFAKCAGQLTTEYLEAALTEAQNFIIRQLEQTKGGPISPAAFTDFRDIRRDDLHICVDSIINVLGYRLALAEQDGTMNDETINLVFLEANRSLGLDHP